MPTLAEALDPNAPVYGFYPHLNPKVANKPDTLNTPEAKGKLAETLLSMAPGSGEAMSLRDAWNASGKGAEAIQGGNYGQAASEYGNLATALLASLPGAGVIARGTKRGAEWMNQNLPAGVNKLVDAMTPKNSQDTLYAIPAWHGSPHDFDKFDMSKIGTGEGAQAYGHGLYFAENPEVAKSYRSALGGTDVYVDGNPFYVGGKKVGTTGDNEIDDALVQHGGDIDKAIYANLKLRSSLEEFNPQAASDMDAQTEKLRAYKANIERRDGGKLYHTELDVEPEDLLDWDKPLAEQSEKVRAAIQKLPIAPDDVVQGRNGRWYLTKDGHVIGTQDGHATEHAARDEFGKMQDISTFTGADILKRFDVPERRLNELGVPGIRYLDQGSRGSGGSSNYVIFNDQLVKILNKE